MKSQDHPTLESLPLPVQAQIDDVCDEFEHACQNVRRPRIEDFLTDRDEPERSALLRELMVLDVRYRANACLEEYEGRFPNQLTTVRDVWRQLDTTFQGTANSTVAAEPLDPTMQCHQLHAAAAPGQTARPRYADVRPHKKGGLGEVLIARDCELNREVALKRIQGKYASHPASKTRFLREAEVTARLEHPGIVPVYGLGFHTDGRPYYAMRLIRGTTLRQKIEEFYADDAEQRLPHTERVTAFRKLLGHFIDVCDAVEFAHSRGVVHRDLKPSNVMVGEYGETIVVDWGFAKTPPPAATDDSTSGAAANPGNTEMGQVCGTPAYMPPEQASGQLDLLGPHSDVYSLGATLYHLITGRVPFLDANQEDTLDKVRRGQLIRPREARPEIARGLEAICLKAMSVQPSQRYGSAKEMALDINRWLANEPVLAFPEPWGIRLKRWLKRRKLVLAGLAASLLVGFVSLAIGFSIVTEKNRQLQQTSQRAGRNFQMAKQVVAGLIETSADRELLHGPGAHKFRQLLLEKGRTYYEQFLAENDTPELSPELMFELMVADNRLGFIALEMDQLEDASEYFQRALATGERLAPDEGNQWERDLERMIAHSRLGKIEFKKGQLTEATKRLQTAIEIGERSLIDRTELGAARHYELINAYDDLGKFEYHQQPGPSALQRFERSVEIGKQLLSESTVTKHRTQVARTCGNYATLCRVNDQPARALAHYQLAIDIYEQVMRENLDSTNLQSNVSLTTCRVGSAYCLVSLGQGRSALAALDQAESDVTPVLQRDNLDAYDTRLLQRAGFMEAEICATRAWLLATSPDESLRDGRRAVADATRACELAEWKNHHYLDTLAAAHAETGNFDEAVRVQREALELAPTENPDFQARLELYEKGQRFRTTVE